jgi:glucan phosphoethanolaminetransferase (alkaline phosphatase superfamily)
MQFGLLLSQFPHVQESRAHYDALLVLHTRESHPFVAFLRRLMSRVA